MFLKRILRVLCILNYYVLGKTIGILYYDKKYLSGKWFDGIHADGWRWVVNDYLGCRKLRVNITQRRRWPVSPQICVVYPDNIEFSLDDLNNFQGFGNYFQAIGKITIGKGCYIAPNVGLITSNHNVYDLDQHDDPKPIVLGEQCWIGMNAMILPGVHLGNHTIVAAGAVVTKSFPKGNCIVAGNPARIIREL